MTAFDEYRDLLFSVAYRILGTVADAEDVVQDTWVKWSAADRTGVAEPKAYLARITTGLAIDRLRQRQARRESYLGPWLPEPVVTTEDTADDVSIALLLVLENLTPLERAVFVLHEAFGFTHAEIAEAVDRSPDTVRQAAHRAREYVSARRPTQRKGISRPTRARHREVTERFLAAAVGGDLNTLLDLLAPGVTLWTDGGGKVRQAMRPVVGAERVAAWFAGVGTRPYEGVDPADMTAEVLDLNGTAGVVFRGAGRVVATLTLDLDENGRIAGLHNVANPDKLRAVANRPSPD
ncbi:RNA polymerase sigma factor SigJ [Cryptosporangium arvum]|uniref:RNA polymerase sigma factor, sigma-70 family n=1 Tax=Cryptosporangium arvum DSM 44712 TaxID=927661 RepID=A0A011AI82_9ACTN|nr:RNA polymerase sigma factor SigJ [Cryptosporangium arvum]EXG81701.1 RNA polymerase sigma factor, sigma-70 family [Cryptosporangium arvum DSM 44712]